MMFNIKNEIEEILDKKAFMTYHEAKGHCLTEHLIDDSALRQKLWDMPKPKYVDDIVMATRFFTEKSALCYIHDALLHNMDKIVNWRKSLLYPYLEITEEFEEAVGEGLCKNPRNTFFRVHGLRILLIANDNEGRAFYIKTAYPVRTLDDNDTIYDAIDGGI